MWFSGYLNENTAYEAKVFENPSSWGINDGRVSKLLIYKMKDGEWDLTYEYDRGGEVGEIDEADLKKVLSFYDGKKGE